jgi:Raf kinase inhibitor-like YbhB/YbcL family protein
MRRILQENLPGRLKQTLLLTPLEKCPPICHRGPGKPGKREARSFGNIPGQFFWANVVLLFFSLASCRSAPPASSAQKANPNQILVTSTAFTDGSPIPAKFSCQGKNVSPPLEWTALPQGIRSAAILCEDPDAPGGTFTHWVLYDIPPTVKRLTENTPKLEVLPNSAKQGLNDFEQTGYGGPCPPPGKPHRYYFRIFALDLESPLKPATKRDELLRIVKGHVLGEGKLMGTFKR